MRFAMIAVMMSATPAMATDVAEQAMRCWNPPGAVDPGDTHDVDATFDLTISDTGAVTDIKVTDYSPDTERGRDLVRAASMAIERCAPYPDATSGEVRFAPNDDGPIDPLN